MGIVRRVLIGVVVLAAVAVAQDKKSPLVGPIEYLWPKGAPLAQGDAEGDKPNLSLYLLPGATEKVPTVVVCPGGGYGALAKGHEGHDIATWLNQHGMSA